MSKYKETTARAVIYRMVGVENILTVENSFYGAKDGDLVREYTPEVVGKIAEGIL